MLELLLALAILFPFVFFIFCLEKFIMIKLPIIIIQLIFCCILLFSNNYYKKHELWKNGKYELIHELPFSPICELTVYYGKGGSFDYLGVYTLYDRTYSLNKTGNYTKKCLDNYYIDYNNICPITQIYLYKPQSFEYSSFHELIIRYGIISNRIIYYSNNYSSDGRLFETTKEFSTKLNFDSEYDSEYFKKIKKKEEHKISNPLIKLKNYIKYADFICLLLLILSFIYTFFEKCDNREFNFIKIINIFIQIIIFILYLFRYIKFIKVKNFFFNNEDIYGYTQKEVNYYPDPLLNIDSIPVALSFYILIINAIYAIVPEKCKCWVIVI